MLESITASTTSFDGTAFLLLLQSFVLRLKFVHFPVTSDNWFAHETHPFLLKILSFKLIIYR